MAEKYNSQDKPTVFAPLATDKKVPLCRGTVLFQLKEGARLNAGEAKLNAAIEKASPESKEIFKSMIISDAWYPESAVAEMAKIEFKLLGKETVFKIVRARAVNTMSTVYKILLRLFISPQKFAENNKRLWDSLHNSGDFKVTVNEPKTHTIEISDFDFITSEYLLSWVEYHSAVLEMTGAKNIKSNYIKTKDKYIFKFSWD